jgi:hypothetical protein
MSTRQVLLEDGGLGEGDAASWPGLCTVLVVAMHARSSASLHTRDSSG